MDRPHMRATPTSAPARCAMWLTPPAPTPPTAAAIFACGQRHASWERCSVRGLTVAV